MAQLWNLAMEESVNSTNLGNEFKVDTGKVNPVKTELDEPRAQVDNPFSEKPHRRLKRLRRVVEEEEDLKDGEVQTPFVDGNSYQMGNEVKLDIDEAKPTVEESDAEDNLTEMALEKAVEAFYSIGSSIEESFQVDQVIFNSQGTVPEGSIHADKDTLGKEGDREEFLDKRNEETTKEGTFLSQDTELPFQPKSGIIDEDTVKLALSKRADYLKSQRESLTVNTVRHLLEEDLGVGRDGLKLHRLFIRTLVDEFLTNADKEASTDPLGKGAVKEEEAGVSSEGKKKKREAKVPKAKKGARGEEHGEGEETLQDKGVVSDTFSEERRPKKVRKLVKKETEVKTKTMVVKKTTADVKKPFSAEVERLRDILKTAGIGVSPIVYKKAKQAPEEERDQVLITELQNRLKQEGLPPNPTEKEIRRVKARLDKKRELDGIECSNIVEEPRRRRVPGNSWFAPPTNRYSVVEDQDSEDDAFPSSLPDTSLPDT